MSPLPAAVLLAHLRDPDCQHTRGWMEGCVLDGLGGLSAIYPDNGYAFALRGRRDGLDTRQKSAP